MVATNRMDKISLTFISTCQVSCSFDVLPSENTLSEKKGSRNALSPALTFLSISSFSLVEKDCKPQYEWIPFPQTELRGERSGIRLLVNPKWWSSSNDYYFFLFCRYGTSLSLSLSLVFLFSLFSVRFFFVHSKKALLLLLQ